MYNHKLEIIREPIKDLVSEDRLTVKLLGKTIPANRICLLDMKAESALSPEDKNKFDVVLFGGILGDIPSKDKTSILRKEGF
jgi:ribosome biogenesis SPOUT family RNA methylase Rps3